MINPEATETKIIVELYWSGKEVTTVDMAKKLSLTNKQVNRALENLKYRNIVKRRRVMPSSSNGIWHPGCSYSKLTNPAYTEEKLREQGII